MPEVVESGGQSSLLSGPVGSLLSRQIGGGGRPLPESGTGHGGWSRLANRRAHPVAPAPGSPVHEPSRPAWDRAALADLDCTGQPGGGVEQGACR